MLNILFVTSQVASAAWRPLVFGMRKIILDGTCKEGMRGATEIIITVFLLGTTKRYQLLCFYCLIN